MGTRHSGESGDAEKSDKPKSGQPVEASRANASESSDVGDPNGRRIDVYELPRAALREPKLLLGHE